jgi:hypothetical protein
MKRRSSSQSFRYPASNIRTTSIIRMINIVVLMVLLASTTQPAGAVNAIQQPSSRINPASVEALSLNRAEVCNRSSKNIWVSVSGRPTKIPSGKCSEDSQDIDGVWAQCNLYGVDVNCDPSTRMRVFKIAGNLSVPYLYPSRAEYEITDVDNITVALSGSNQHVVNPEYFEYGWLPPSTWKSGPHPWSPPSALDYRVDDRKVKINNCFAQVLCRVYKDPFIEYHDPLPTPSPITPSPLPSPNGAAFVSDVTVRDGTVLSPNQSFVKTWRLKNTGGTTWSSGYRLAFVGGNQLNAPESVALPRSVAPNTTVDISVTMRTPSAGGTYQGDWRLRDAQGVYFGDRVWVKISVPVPSGSTQPPSIGSAADVDVQSVQYPSVVTPGQSFRPKVTVRVNQGQLLQSRGDMLRNTDGNLYGAWQHVVVSGTVNAGQSYTFEFYANNPITAPSSQGTYESKWRVWRNGAWAGSEIVIRFDVRNGGGTRPNSPTLTSPSNWYASRSGGTPTLCASAPGGLQYSFQIYESHDTPQSGWIDSSCWTPPNLGPYTYKWHVKVRDVGTGLESDWSEAWNFTIDSQSLSIEGIFFSQSSPSAADEVGVWACVRGFGMINNDINVFANTATDGSASGTWQWIDHLPGGVCTQDVNDPSKWPKWHTRSLADGTHLIRAVAWRGTVAEGNYQQVVQTATYTLQRRRPSNVQQLSPASDTWLNSRAITLRWNPEESQRVQRFRLHVSTDSDPTVNPIVAREFDATAREFSYTFDQDYSRLYWRIQACNELGCGDASATSFGIDRTNPSAAVSALATTTFETVFQVDWTGGSDNAAGIRWYDVQFRDGERGEWVDWQTNVSSTTAIFTGQPGHTYYFRARAYDHAGNQEAYPADDGDTATTINPAAAPATPWWNSAYAHKRNILVLNNVGNTMSASYPVHLRFDSGTTPTAAELYAASQSSTKGDDIRVIYHNTTELPRWVQTFSSSRIDIWFKTQANIGGTSASDTDYQLYYGNASAVNPPGDIDDVMGPGKDNNTIGLWHFADGAGAAFKDTSGRGHNGNLPNAHTWGEDAFGPYIEWAGGGDNAAWGEVSSSSYFDINTMTLEAWVYPISGGSSEMTIFYRPLAAPDNCPGYKLAVSDMQTDLQLNCAAGRDIGGQIPPNTWTHIAATYDGGTMRIYRNGTLIRTVAYNQSVRSTMGRMLYLGGSPFSQTFKGRVRHARLSNIARSEFSYAASIAAITTAPSLAVGDSIEPPSTGAANLSILSVTTASNVEGEVFAQAVVQNQGNDTTANGFYIDLYANHQPTGTGDYTDSIQFWEASPLDAGGTITLTTILSDTQGSSATALAPLTETTDIFYIQADSTGVVSESNNTDNISPGLEVCRAAPDAYEGDDTAATAKLLPIGQARTYNVTEADDTDWVRFEAQAGLSYVIHTANLGPAADTYLYLYGVDRTTLLASNDDQLATDDDTEHTLASRIEWTAPASGTYYVQVQHWNPNIQGCGTKYDLVVETATSLTTPISIYSDSLAGGWENWSWGTTVDLAGGTIVQSGNHAISVRYDQAWAGFYLHHAGISPATISTLEFAIHGGTGGGQQIKLYAKNSSGVDPAPISLNPYIEGGSLAANTWRMVRVPLSALNLGSNALTGIVLQDDSGSSQPVFYLDGIRLLRSTSVAPTPTPTPSPTPVAISIYNDALGEGWENWSWGTTINFTGSGIVHGGSRAMSVQYDQAWAGVYLHHAGINPTTVGTLEFAIHGGTSGGQQLNLYAKNSSGVDPPAVALNQYVEGGSVAANTWRMVRVPLSALNLGTNALTGVVIQDASGGSQPIFHLDSIQLVEGS